MIGAAEQMRRSGQCHRGWQDDGSSRERLRLPVPSEPTPTSLIGPLALPLAWGLAPRRLIEFVFE
jgi:hypothetical protein